MGQLKDTSLHSPYLPSNFQNPAPTMTASSSMLVLLVVLALVACSQAFMYGMGLHGMYGGGLYGGMLGYGGLGYGYGYGMPGMWGMHGLYGGFPGMYGGLWGRGYY